jgi:hypothetical protein
MGSPSTPCRAARVIASLPWRGAFSHAIGVAGPVWRLKQKEAMILGELRASISRFMGEGA